MAAHMVKILHLGRMGYRQALKVQERCVVEVKAGRVESLLLAVEHPPVYTTGIRTKVYSVEEEKLLLGRGADFVRTNRGGLITFHGPGQLVLYPILDLKKFLPQSKRRKAALGMKWYIHTLEEMVIQLCKEFELTASRSPHTGVWVGDNKICAMGVHSSDLVTSHGLALNCNVDLKWFGHIVPCGIEGKGVTSLTAELGQETSIQDVLPRIISQFESVFSTYTKEATEDEIQRLVEVDKEDDERLVNPQSEL